jgi:hypothetical protein
MQAFNRPLLKGSDPPDLIAACALPRATSRAGSCGCGSPGSGWRRRSRSPCTCRSGWQMAPQSVWSSHTTAHPKVHAKGKFVRGADYDTFSFWKWLAGVNSAVISRDRHHGARTSSCRSGGSWHSQRPLHGRSQETMRKRGTIDWGPPLHGCAHLGRGWSRGSSPRCRPRPRGWSPPRARCT